MPEEAKASRYAEYFIIEQERAALMTLKSAKSNLERVLEASVSFISVRKLVRI